MKRAKELLAAVFLILVTLWVSAVPVSARVRAGSPQSPGVRRGSTSLQEPAPRQRRFASVAGPHFVIRQESLACVAAPSRHPAAVPRLHPRRPDLRKSSAREDNPSAGDLDTDTDGGAFTVVSYRYRLAADTREADLPLGVELHPQAPVIWSGSPRGPPVS